MAQKKNNDQILVRIDMENGIPRVRQVTGEELKQFLKTHPKLKLPTFSLADMNRAVTTLEEINPSTINPSGR